MTVRTSTNIHFNEGDVWHRWHPGDDKCDAYGALKFGDAATLYFGSKPELIDKVIAELVALKQEMAPPVITDSERTGEGGVLFPAGDEDGPMDDEAELRRADAYRDDPASPDAAEALIDAIVAGTPVKSIVGRIVEHADDDSPCPVTGKVVGQVDEDTVEVLWGERQFEESPGQGTYEPVDALRPARQQVTAP